MRYRALNLFYSDHLHQTFTPWSGRNLIGIAKTSAFQIEYQLVFCKHHSSRTSYHARTDWLQYWINLVTLLPVKFQQKTNISLNDLLDPQIIIGFSACFGYAKCRLYFFISIFFALKIDLIKETQMWSNKYRNQWDELNKIVIIAIYSTHFFKWCRPISNYYLLLL